MGKILYFNSPTQGRLSFEEVVDSIISFMREDPDVSYRLIIGTDSREHREGSSIQAFVTALIIHRIGFGGRYFWRKTFRRGTRSIREKIYAEAMLSLEVSQQFLQIFNNLFQDELSDYKIEIHVDVGNNGPTRHLIRELVGMIESFGFIARVKPESFGASRVAHRHT